MKIKRILLVTIVVAILGTLLTGCAMLAKPEVQSAAELLKQANAAVVDAQNTKGNEQQAEKFTKAMSLYQRAATRAEQEPKKPGISAQASLALGKVQAGIPVESTPKNGLNEVYVNKIQSNFLGVYPRESNLQDDFKSRETFAGIVQKAWGNQSLQQLKDNYGEDASAIKSAVDQATWYRLEVFKSADKKSQGDIRYKFMELLVRATGKLKWLSYWFAMVLLAVIVKIIITPLTKAQFKSMKEMQRIQPLIKEMQQKYKDDQQELGRRTMALYKEHGVNPLAGCLPLVIQIPILIGVYSMIRLFEYQFTNGTFLWIGWAPFAGRLSYALMGKPVYLPASNLAQPDLILLVLYTVSLIISQRISIVDPTQAEQQKMMSIMMPIMFFFILGSLPAAFIFYWFVFNVLQTWQQYHIIHETSAAQTAIPASTETEQPQSQQRRRRRR